MREELLEVLRCPVCRGQLALTVRTKHGEEIETGTLACGRCRVDYPIDDGIPDLLPPDQRS
jgi:uncharacterized protein